MVYSLTYRRPSRVSSSNQSLSGDEKQQSINESISSESSCMSHGIPEALSFDRIINGGTCPPCTVRDFMNYLKYIEFSAENLQFFLWSKDYVQRFDQLPKSEQSLAPIWTVEQSETSASATSKTANATAPEAFRGTDFAHSSRHSDPFVTPAKTPSLEEKRGMTSSDYGSSTGDSSQGTKATHHTVAESAFEDAGMKWKPFSVQPYRDEIDRVISVYIAEGSPRELNLSSRDRSAVLHALQHTTHPSAFRSIIRSVEYTLRRQAHPNFIRWTICNGNRPRVIFARGLGIGGIVIGLVADIIITLSSVSRPWRIIPFAGWFIGIATLIAAWKGMCVVLHGMHHRHLRPWEMFSDEPDDVLDEKVTSRESFVSQSTNSYEDEPWVARYQKRNIIRKVFDREVWVTEPALRQIQDTIFLQAILGAFVMSAIVVGIFCAVPRGKFY